MTIITVPELVEKWKMTGDQSFEFITVFRKIGADYSTIKDGVNTGLINLFDARFFIIELMRIMETYGFLGMCGFREEYASRFVIFTLFCQLPGVEDEMPTLNLIFKRSETGEENEVWLKADTMRLEW